MKKCIFSTTAAIFLSGCTKAAFIAGIGLGVAATLQYEKHKHNTVRAIPSPLEKKG